ncbi:MAG: lipoprotein signal peptidase [Paramuribaculum sp.]|nr:lipoprotein signal peptidase [Paramuribaculum sp.]
MKLGKGWIAFLVILAVIIIDQVIKIWVKTHFYIGEDFRITDWFQLVFVQNNGMAFGMEMGPKLFLTIFRILAVIALIWVICRVRKRDWASVGFIVCLALITAGALGNIIDCVFYGVIFNDPAPYNVAVMFPEGGGYAPLLQGKVVDMFYFPLFSFYWPDWMPFVGGQNFLFFQPVFNFADSAITVGMILMIIFYSRHLSGDHHSPKEAEEN